MSQRSITGYDLFTIIFHVAVWLFWFFVALLVIGGLYYVASDWASARHVELHSFADYCDAVSSAFGDRAYIKNLAARLQPGGKPTTETALPAADTASPFDAAYGCSTSAAGDPDDHIVRLDQKNKSVREIIKYTAPMHCEFAFKDGVFGPLVNRDTCDLPFPTTNVFQRVEFADATVFFGFFPTSSVGPLTSEQRAGLQRFDLKTGVMVATNGDRYQCRQFPPK